MKNIIKFIKKYFQLIIVIILLFMVVLSGYYFLYELPKYNRKKLNLERMRQEFELELKGEAKKRKLQEQKYKEQKDTEFKEQQKIEKQQIEEKIEKNKLLLNNCLSSVMIWEAESKKITENFWENRCKKYEEKNNFPIAIGCYEMVFEKNEEIKNEAKEAKKECYLRYEK